ncbi:MAG: 50S ribosomal protein L21 [Deltaproteobacteria bacterium]|nr:50S ribosomal protein L21 [Deltaproteobacteria bacterium]
MYAVIKSGGRQHKVAVGQAIRVARLPAESGEDVVLGQVLMVYDGQAVRVGRPLVDGVTVKATVLGHDRAKKILVFKKKRRKGYHKAQGHRQDYTAVKITAIETGAGAGEEESHGS